MTTELQIRELLQENGLLKERVAKLERTMAFLLAHTNATYVDHPDTGPFPDVAALVYAGNRLGALKLYREKTGASLAEAEKFIAGL